MSTLAATNLKHASSASNNIVLDSSGNATFAGTAVPASSFLRNRIINGAMDIAQRGTSGTTGYLVDRWTALNTSAQSQSSDAPTGFLNSLEFTSSSATFPFVSQRIERINSYDLAGRTVTFSLWAKNVSGASNLYVEIYRANTNDNFSAVTLEGSVVLSASPSASWTFYSGSIALSASATTGIELRIIRNNAAAASTRLTGVQLEVGTAATPFERRQYGQELMLCQRYYYQSPKTGVTGSGGWGTMYGSTAGRVWFPLAVTMRADPTVTTSGTTFEYIGIGTATMTVSNVIVAPHVVTLDGTGGPATGALGRPFSYNGTVQASAEL